MTNFEFAQGFAGQLSPGKAPVILSIDLMRGYFQPGSPFLLPDTQFLDVASDVISAARQNEIPVIHTAVRFGAEGRDGGLFIQKIPALRAFIDDQTDNEIMPAVAPNSSETVILKNYASAFFGTTLSSTLQSQGVDTVIIVGTSTSGCVRATAVDALQHGFIPIVVSDAVGDREKTVHEASLYDLQAKYAEVVRAKNVIDLLNQRSALAQND